MFEDSAIAAVLAGVVVRVDATILFFDRYILADKRRRSNRDFKKYDVETDNIECQYSDEIICVGLSQNMWIIRDRKWWNGGSDFCSTIVMTAKTGVHVDKKGVSTLIDQQLWIPRISNVIHEICDGHQDRRQTTTTHFF